ncbi:hypothetical protein H0H93_012143 [Arthromyces matolae]|nr:hypothetical protein H0H93_012143 [Arthromyces matolae]
MDSSNHHHSPPTGAPVRSHPTYISLPTTPLIVSDSPDVSPLYLTPPSTPYYTPPTSPHIDIPLPHLQDDLNDDQIPLHDDPDLPTLERIYLFASSKASYHKIYITHALPQLILQISPHDAVHYVLPLLVGLAMDEEEQVKEALAAELVSIIWSFFTHCDMTSEDPSSVRPFASTSTSQPIATVSVQAFTPILGTLLLSPNPLVGGVTRHAIVDLLLRLKHDDDTENSTLVTDDDDSQAQHPSNRLDRPERDMLRSELVQQVVIGMGRLDSVLDEQDGPLPGRRSRQGSEPRNNDTTTKSDSVNPYFPIFPSTPSTSLSLIADSTSASLSVTPSRPLHDSIPLSPTTEETSGLAHGRGEHSHSPDFDIHQKNAYGSDHGEEDEQATVGRLSSLSLMAAVTASGSIGEDFEEEFVNEVVRVGQDPVYWVRREASFALGALAKVVPEEIVIGSLLPLFDTLRRDSVWHVRHSSLFALPAILSRLSAKQRRSLALDTITTLAKDESSTVQSGVLEALGEVLYTFYEDDDEPPKELVDLFLGRREDRRLRDGQQLEAPDLLLNIVERPLICAFNYPAVALTLGRERWGDLRSTYLELATDRNVNVRRTLAASVGELAKIIGTEHAQRDLVGVWWDGIRCEEEEVRTRAVESLVPLMDVVGKEVADSLLDGVVTIWDEGGFSRWREREGLAATFETLGTAAGPKGQRSIVALVQRALEDPVSAVREAAVRSVTSLWQRDNGEQLGPAIASLAQSPVFKRRISFIACQHALSAVVPLDNSFFSQLLPLADDPIDAVRIRLARLVASVPPSSSTIYAQLILRLSGDLPDVSAYVLHPNSHHPLERYSIFSRPPAQMEPPATLVPLPSTILPDSADDQTQPIPRPADSHLPSDPPLSAAVSKTSLDGNPSASVLSPYVIPNGHFAGGPDWLTFDFDEGLFIACNAIVASVAVWNHSLAQATDLNTQFDLYLIFLGCLGLVHIFTVLVTQIMLFYPSYSLPPRIFIELAYRHSITGRVWFECLWFGVFCLMYMAWPESVRSKSFHREAGASAASALFPTNSCTFRSERLTKVSEVLFYFSLLVIASLLHLPSDSQIFHCYVHKFPWGEVRRTIHKAPPSPTLSQTFRKMPPVVAPKPQRPPPVAIYNHRAGLSSEYEIESYATPKPDEVPLPPFTPPSALFSVLHQKLDEENEEPLQPQPQTQRFTAPSFYPRQVQAAMTQGPTLQQSDRPASQPVRSSSTQKQLRLHQAPPSEPSPLGVWPRRDTLTSPSAKYRRKPPPDNPQSISIPAAASLPHIIPPSRAIINGPPPSDTMVTVLRNPSFPPRARPSGPRRRSDETRVVVPELLGRSIPVSTIFLILESVALFGGVAVTHLSSRGTVELIIPRAIAGRTLFECVWTAILSVFQIGKSYISALAILTYSMALFISAIAHVHLVPAIWTESIYSVDWFKLRVPDLSEANGLDSEADSWSRYMKDIETGRHIRDKNANQAPWAKTIRRGIDVPFKSNGPSAATSPSETSTSLPVAPLRIQSRAESRFIERFRESSRLSRPDTVSQMQTGNANQRTINAFPARVEDYDLPIPLPDHSKWVRADEIKS